MDDERQKHVLLALLSSWILANGGKVEVSSKVIDSLMEEPPDMVITYDRQAKMVIVTVQSA